MQTQLWEKEADGIEQWGGGGVGGVGGVEKPKWVILATTMSLSFKPLQE